MQVLKPGEVVFDEAQQLELDAIIRAKLGHNSVYGTFHEDKFEELPPMDALAARLGIGQVPMRRKQGIFKPRKITVATLGAWRIGPPPALVVQFDNNGIKTTYPMVL